MSEFQDSFIATGRDENGVFSMTNPNNPFRDWHIIVAPYCTGDVHCGSNAKGVIPGGKLGTQMFVGFDNVSIIARYAASILDVEGVVLAGTSAGGYGAVGNWAQVQETFGDIPVDMLSDAAPIHPSNRVMTESLEHHWRTMWGMDQIVPEDCLECKQKGEDGKEVGLEHVLAYQARRNPDRVFAVISSTGDCTMRGFHRLRNPYGARIDAECWGTERARILNVSRTDYRNSVYHLRDNTYADLPNVAMFIPDNVDHGHLPNRYFYQRSAGGVMLYDWLSDLTEGDVYTTYDEPEAPTEVWTVGG